MSLASDTVKNSYIGDNAAFDKQFDYTFKVFDVDNLRVIASDSEGTEHVLAKTTDFTATKVGNTGGKITLVNAVEGQTDEFNNPILSPTQPWLDVNGYLANGYKLTIKRARPLTQSTSIRNQGNYYPTTHEDTFDKLAMVDQQQQEEIGRTVKLPESLDESDFDPTLPKDIEGQVSRTLLTNSNGNGFVIGPKLEEIVNSEQYAQDALASKGLAQEWAIKTGETVTDTTEYSAKEYAVGTSRRGEAEGGSAKDWASYTGGKVDNLYYSARYYAEQAASLESITQTSSGSISNNQSLWENIPDFTLDATLFSSAKFILEIYRHTDSQQAFANGELYLQRRGGVWVLRNGQFVGDQQASPVGDGVSFQVTESGGVAQVQYRSSDLAGSNYIGNIKFRRLAFNV